jgi:crossover junction endodeoxyribonuclease RuvC
MFRFAEACGGIYGLLVGLGLPVTFIRPQQWQKGGAADATRQRAVQLFPDAAALLTRQNDCQRADALLIAAYGIVMRNTKEMAA